MTKSELSKQNKRLQSENNELKRAIYNYLKDANNIEAIKTFVAVVLEIDYIKRSQAVLNDETYEVEGIAEMIENLFNRAKKMKIVCIAPANECDRNPEDVCIECEGCKYLEKTILT